jgi:Zn finger protein HypA/HybF involved in hydrogenase expression
MSDSQSKNAHMADRAERAAKIIEQPEEYKICDGCDSILTVGAVTCPNCHSYRFDTDPQTVAAHAQVLASRAQTSITHEDMY